MRAIGEKQSKTRKQGGGRGRDGAIGPNTV